MTTSIQFSVKTGEITEAKADIVMLGILEEGTQKLTGGAAALDKALKGILKTSLAKQPTFKGKVGQVLLLPLYEGMLKGTFAADFILLVGLGKKEELKPCHVRRAVASAMRICTKQKAKTVVSLLPGSGEGGLDPAEAARMFSEGAILGTYQFLKHKSKAKEDGEEEESKADTKLKVTLLEIEKNKVKAIEKGLHIGETVATHTNLARDLVFDSANHVTPTVLKKEAEKIAKEFPHIQCNVLDMADLKKLKMGSFVSVARGSEEPPYLLHLSYVPKKKAKKKIALVGKGLTFDSGGLSLKTSGSMELMKMDMGGAAAVLMTMRALATLVDVIDLPYEVHGFVGTCENMPSGHASRPGDIVTSMKGKTIEVNNTDAEGRLVLADVLTYAQKTVKPDEVIDLATLTGACIIALGKVAAGIMGNDQPLVDRITQHGESAGEKYWQLPLYEEYKDSLKSDVADLINSGSKGEAGTSSGGMFLQEFVEKGVHWAHLDIAGPAYTGKDIPEVPKGATGFGVRTLLYYLFGW